MTGCIFYTSDMFKIPFVTLTNVTCCYALKFNPLNAKLNPICHLLSLGAHHILHVSRIRVNSVYVLAYECGQDIVVGIVTCYGLDSLGIESRWK
jgi:hypothetical protein